MNFSISFTSVISWITIPLTSIITWTILNVIYFYLPAAVANMAPVLFKWIPFGKTPVDFGKKWRGKRILGDHKTIRGLIVGIISAIVIVHLQKNFFAHFLAKFSFFGEPFIIDEFLFIDYQGHNSTILLGFLFGFGALIGDLFKSFFKRRIGIAEGKSWPPFDQLDWIIGANLAVSLAVKIPPWIILSSLIILGLLHPVVNLLGYVLKIKKEKF